MSSKFLRVMALSKTPADFKKPAGIASSVSTVDSLATVDALSTVDTLTRDPDGHPVDPKLCKPASLVQHGHTPGENAVYMALWNRGGPPDRKDEFRDVSIGYDKLAALVGGSKRNVQRLAESLVRKLAIQIIRVEDSGTRQGKTYRVFGMAEVLRRRKEAGYTSVVRNRSAVTLVRTASLTTVDKLTTVDSLSTVTVDKLTTVTVDSLSTPLGSSFRNKTEESSSSSPSSVVVKALRTIDPGTDDDGAAQLIEASRKACPDATDEEIAHFILLKGSNKGIQQPLAFLKTAVPKCLQGESLRQYRRDAQQAKEAQAQQDRLQREHWQQILDNPGSDEQSRTWAREALALPAKE
jgi:hypothetical protein